MDLQQQQLQQLSDWLSQTEERIMKIETEPPAKDLEDYKERIEQHKVNSLSLGAAQLCRCRGDVAVSGRSAVGSADMLSMIYSGLPAFSHSRSFRTTWRRSR